MDACDFLPVVCKGEAEGEFSDAFRFRSGDDLEGFDDTVHRLVLKARVFAFCVLTDNAEINVVVARLVAWNVLDENDGSVNIELLSQCDVEGLVTGSLNWRVKNTLQTKLVSLQGRNGLAEKIFRVLVSAIDT